MPAGVLVALVPALVRVTLLATVHRWRNRRFGAPVTTAGAGPGADANPPAGPRLTSSDIGAPLGEQATLVQFSSAFCAPCRAARTLLGSVAEGRDAVSYVDVDAESHLGLVREMGVLRTPTVLVLDRAGRIVSRTSGLPRRGDVESVLARVAPLTD